MYEGGTYAPARGLAAPPARRRCARLAERDRLRFVSRPARRASRVLEVGAGDGKLVAAMRAAGLDARGHRSLAGGLRGRRARSGSRSPASGVDEAEVEPASQDAVVLWHALEHLDDPRRGAASGSAAGCGPAGALVVAVPNLARCRRGSAATGGFIRTCRATAPTSPRRRSRRCSSAAAIAVERIRHLLVEQNPLGMWQTLLNRLTGERDFAFRLLKRDLGPATAPRARSRPRGDRDRRAAAGARGDARRARRRARAARRLDRGRGEGR